MEYNSSETTERLMDVAKCMELNDVALGMELGVSRQSVNQMRRKIAGVPLKRLVSFIGSHREINTDWILFGDGEMFTEKGIHKFTMTNEGDMHFSVDSSGEKNELEKIKALAGEKDRHIASLQETIRKQGDYIEKLLDKI